METITEYLTTHNIRHRLIKYVNNENVCVFCGMCGAYVVKTKQSLKNPKCRYCPSKYSRLSYVYGISNTKITKRLLNGWTMNEALELVPRNITNETFSDKDLRYLQRFLEKNYTTDKISEEKAYLKHKITSISS